MSWAAADPSGRGWVTQDAGDNATGVFLASAAPSSPKVTKAAYGKNIPISAGTTRTQSVSYNAAQVR